MRLPPTILLVAAIVSSPWALAGPAVGTPPVDVSEDEDARAKVVAASLGGNASCKGPVDTPVGHPCVAASGNGTAEGFAAASLQGPAYGWVAASGTGPADGIIVASGTGEATSCGAPDMTVLPCLAVSGTGHAEGDLLAVSPLGSTDGENQVNGTDGATVDDARVETDEDAAACREPADLVCVAFSGTGDASCHRPERPCLAASGLGEAACDGLACTAASVGGDATASWVAVSVLGDAEGGLVAASIGGGADGGTAVSGCATHPTLCVDGPPALP